LLLLTIWPLFALICLGFVLYRKGFPDQGFWSAAERLNYFLLFPALLVASLARAPVRDPEVLRLGLAAVVTILLAFTGFVIARRLRPTPATRFGPAVQGAVRFNTYLGLAITGSLAGPEGLQRAAVYLAVCVPVVNVLSILALTEKGQGRGILSLLRAILTNPLILGCLAGLALSISGVGLPFGTDRFLDLLAKSSLPLGLLCVGAALRPASMTKDLPVIIGNSAIRLGIMPLLAATVGWLFGLQGHEALTLVVFSAIPTAAASYVLTQQMKGDGTLMAGLVTGQTLIAIVTIPLMLQLLGLA
jgi:predicted permease